MSPSLQHVKLRAVEHMSQRDLQVVLAAALEFQQAAHAGRTPRLLHGRNLALLSAPHADAEASLFHHAATELGAQVAHLRHGDPGLDTPSLVRDTGRILGRLYDAVDCHGLPATLVEQLHRHAGVPVYDRLATKVPCTNTLASLVGRAVGPDFRRHALQALLVATLL